MELILTSLLPISQIEAHVANTWPSRHCVIILKMIKVWRRDTWGRPDHVVSIKMYAHFEGDGIGAGGGVRRASWGGPPVHSADPVGVEGPGAEGRCLEGRDVQVVTVAHPRGGRGRESCSTAAEWPYGALLGRPTRAGPQAVGGGRARGGGEDLRGVADGAGALGPPDADVVVLAGQVSLCGGHRARARVPVEAGDCTLAG